MIERRVDDLAERDFDLVVVGGGIYGVMLTLESARRGLRPLLLERSDFGAATSWNSLRIVHGGLRYLQSLDLPRFRESVAERAWLMRDFPELVEPLACLMPLYGRGLRRPSVLRLALFADTLLGRPIHRSIAPDRMLERGRVLSARETIERFPKVDRDGLLGAALWFDAVMADSQRLVVEALHWACSAGARALNYVEARALLTGSGTVAGIRARDLEADAELEVRAPLVVNCGGPWCREIAAAFDRDVPELFEPSLAFNVLLDRPSPADCALAVAPPRGGPTFFLHPWKGRVLAGTVHLPAARDPAGPLPPGEASPPGEEAVAHFLADLSRAVPGLDARAEHVERVHWGLLPVHEAGTTRLTTRPQILDHAAHGGPAGLWSLSGVKLTTARAVVERALGRILAACGRELPAAAGPPRPAASWWPPRAELERMLGVDPGAARAAIERIEREEAVCHLDDLLLRRTDWGAIPGDGARLGRRIEACLGRRLGAPGRPATAG
jgi:glycerol-3-phosphate dehydrogenase